MLEETTTSSQECSSEEYSSSSTESSSYTYSETSSDEISPEEQNEILSWIMEGFGGQALSAYPYELFTQAFGINNLTLNIQMLGYMGRHCFFYTKSPPIAPTKNLTSQFHSLLSLQDILSNNLKEYLNEKFSKNQSNGTNAIGDFQRENMLGTDELATRHKSQEEISKHIERFLNGKSSIYFSAIFPHLTLVDPKVPNPALNYKPEDTDYFYFDPIKKMLNKVGYLEIKEINQMLSLEQINADFQNAIQTLSFPLAPNHLFKIYDDLVTEHTNFPIEALFNVFYTLKLHVNSKGKIEVQLINFHIKNKLQDPLGPVWLNPKPTLYIQNEEIDSPIYNPVIYWLSDLANSFVLTDSHHVQKNNVSIDRDAFQNFLDRLLDEFPENLDSFMQPSHFFEVLQNAPLLTEKLMSFLVCDFSLLFLDQLEGEKSITLVDDRNIFFEEPIEGRAGKAKKNFFDLIDNLTQALKKHLFETYETEALLRNPDAINYRQLIFEYHVVRKLKELILKQLNKVEEKMASPWRANFPLLQNALKKQESALYSLLEPLNAAVLATEKLQYFETVYTSENLYIETFPDIQSYLDETREFMEEIESNNFSVFSKPS